VRAGQLSAGAQGQRPRQPAVVVGEASRLVAQQDEAADVLANRHRHRHQALDVQVLGEVVRELPQTAVVTPYELLARLHRRRQRAGAAGHAVDRLRVEALEPNAWRLGHELLAVRRREEVAGEGGPDLVRDVRGQRGDIPRRS
jgi:hypothetical protein